MRSGGAADREKNTLKQNFIIVRKNWAESFKYGDGNFILITFLIDASWGTDDERHIKIIHFFIQFLYFFWWVKKNKLHPFQMVDIYFFNDCFIL